MTGSFQYGYGVNLTYRTGCRLYHNSVAFNCNRVILNNWNEFLRLDITALFTKCQLTTHKWEATGLIYCLELRESEWANAGERWAGVGSCESSHPGGCDACMWWGLPVGCGWISTWYLLCNIIITLRVWYCIFNSLFYYSIFNSLFIIVFFTFQNCVFIPV